MRCSIPASVPSVFFVSRYPQNEIEGILLASALYEHVPWSGAFIFFLSDLCDPQHVKPCNHHGIFSSPASRGLLDFLY